MWTCPECDRRFGKANQSHECAPALTLEEYFESGPEFEQPIFEVVNEHISGLGLDVWVEPVQVGIFFKRKSVFLSLRTMTKWIAVCFFLDRKLEHGRISRKVQEHNGRYYHVVNVRSADDIDDVLLDWLAEAAASDE